MQDISESIGGEEDCGKERLIKFGVDNRGSKGIGCFRIKVRTDTAEFLECIEQSQ